jgi:hypothetical protein
MVITTQNPNAPVDNVGSGFKKTYEYTGNYYIAIYTRTASGEPASYDVSTISITRLAIMCFAIANGSSIVDVEGNGGSTTTVELPDVNAPYADTLQIAVVAIDENSGVDTIGTFTGFTKLGDLDWYNDKVALSVQYKDVTVGGVQSGVTTTTDVAEGHTTYTFIVTSEPSVAITQIGAYIEELAQTVKVTQAGAYIEELAQTVKISQAGAYLEVINVSPQVYITNGGVYLEIRDGITRSYRIRAVNDNGESEWSNVASFTLPEQIEDEYD